MSRRATLPLFQRVAALTIPLLLLLFLSPPLAVAADRSPSTTPARPGKKPPKRTPEPAEALPVEPLVAVYQLSEPTLQEVPLDMPLPPVVPGPVEMHILTAPDSGGKVDSLLNLLGIKAEKNRLLEEVPTAVAGITTGIRVDRFFRYRGNRHVIILGEKDPFQAAELTRLEEAGYQLLRFGDNAPFAVIARKLLDQLKWPYSYSINRIMVGEAEKKLAEVTGVILVTNESPPRQLLITDTYRILPQP
jgi:hypothetical protein